MKKVILFSMLCVFGLMTSHRVDASTSDLHDENKKITITTEKARLFDNSQLKKFKTPKKGSVYRVNGYRTLNGKHYYRLYQNDSHNQSRYCGYLYNGYAKNLAMTKDSGYYKIKSSVNIWKNFYFNQKLSVVNKEQVAYIKGYYVLGDNKKYYSLYQKDKNNKEQWLGYTYNQNMSPLKPVENKQKMTLKCNAMTKDNLFMNHTKQAFQFKQDIIFESPCYYILNKDKIYSLYRPSANGKQEWMGYLTQRDIKVLTHITYTGEDLYRVKDQKAPYYTNLYLTSAHTAMHSFDYNHYFKVKYLYPIGNKTYASIYYRDKYIDVSQNSDAGKWIGYIDVSNLESDTSRANEQDFQYLKEQMDKVKQVETIKNDIDAKSYQTLMNNYYCAENAYNHKDNTIRSLISIATTLHTSLPQLQFNRNPLIKTIRYANYDLKDNRYTDDSKEALRKAISKAQNFLDYATDKDLLYQNKATADRYIVQIETAQKQLVLKSTESLN